MLNIVTTQKHAYTVDIFFTRYSRYFRDCVQLWTYENLDTNHTDGTWLFTDIDRIHASDEMLNAARVLVDKLEQTGATILNHPFKVLNRYDLYLELKQPFRAWRSTEDYSSARFPVFLRNENSHQFHGDLIRSPQELNKELSSRDECLICEFHDTSDENAVYNKYSAFLLNGSIISRHLFFSKKWMLKYTDILKRETLALELKYIFNNPHEEQLRDIFAKANIDYGRIDYSVKDGEIFTWEINTNPNLWSLATRQSLRRLARMRYSNTLLNAEFLRLAGSTRKNTIHQSVWRLLASIPL